MQKRTLIVLLVFLCVVTAAACTPPDETSVAAVAEATTTPIPPPQAVTRGDYPASFLPGILEPGVIPQKAYHIGVVYGIDDDAAFGELEKLCEAYQRLGVTVALTKTSPVRQQTAVAQTLENAVDFLIFAPGGSDTLTEVDTLCTQKNVPYLTMGRRIGAKPGKGRYVCAIEPDRYMAGVLTGLSIAETVKTESGRPFGNIAEITGVVSDEASVLQSMGLRRALAPYDELGVVCSVAGSSDDDTVYQAAENIFRAYRPGELAGITVPDDHAALTVLQAALDYDRDDVVGHIWSVGATVEGLTGVWHGQFAQTVELKGQTGMAAMEYALMYLGNNKADIPPVVTSLTRVFTARTPEQADGVAALIDALKQRGASHSLESVGDYALFLPQGLPQVYPQRDDLGGDEFLTAFEPYTTKAPVYKTRNDAAQK